MRLQKFIPVIFIVVLFSCAATLPEIPDNLAPNEFFKKAQEAVETQSNYDAAIYYYTEFINRFPENIQMIAEAEYEMGFIYFNQGNYEAADAILSQLIERYSQAGSEFLQSWPAVLAGKIKTQIQESSTSKE